MKNTETAVRAIKMFPKKFLKKNLIDFIIQTRKFDFSIIRLVKYMFCAKNKTVDKRKIVPVHSVIINCSLNGIEFDMFIKYSEVMSSGFACAIAFMFSINEVGIPYVFAQSFIVA